MATEELFRMHKEYDTCFMKRCGDCCNYRKKDSRYCLAYGKDYCSDWNPNGEACGLYNKPFAALRPRRSPLGAVVMAYKRVSPQDDKNQISLF